MMQTHLRPFTTNYSVITQPGNRWTQEEDEKLLMGIKEFGSRWTQISEKFFWSKGDTLRTSRQCSFRYKNFWKNKCTPEDIKIKSISSLLKIRNKKATEGNQWSPEDDEKLLKGVEIFKEDWDSISLIYFTSLQGISHNSKECRDHYRNLHQILKAENLNSTEKHKLEASKTEEKSTVTPLHKKNKTKHTPWTSEDNTKLVEGVNTFGRDWKLISSIYFTTPQGIIHSNKICGDHYRSLCKSPKIKNLNEKDLIQNPTNPQIVQSISADYALNFVELDENTLNINDKSTGLNIDMTENDLTLSGQKDRTQKEETPRIKVEIKNISSILQKNSIQAFLSGIFTPIASTVWNNMHD